MEYNIFLKEEYIEPNNLKRVIEYDKYPDFKFLVAQIDDEYAGITRIIRDKNITANQINLPSINDFEIWHDFYTFFKKIDVNGIVEVGTLAIQEKYRGGRLSLIMIGEIIRSSWKQGIFYSLNSLDERFYKMLIRFNLPFTQIGKEKFYMGSVTYPTLFDSKKLTAKQMKILCLKE